MIWLIAAAVGMWAGGSIGGGIGGLGFMLWGRYSGDAALVGWDGCEAGTRFGAILGVVAGATIGVLLALRLRHTKGIAVDGFSPISKTYAVISIAIGTGSATLSTAFFCLFLNSLINDDAGYLFFAVMTTVIAPVAGSLATLRVASNSQEDWFAHLGASIGAILGFIIGECIRSSTSYTTDFWTIIGVYETIGLTSTGAAVGAVSGFLFPHRSRPVERMEQRAPPERKAHSTRRIPKPGSEHGRSRQSDGDGA